MSDVNKLIEVIEELPLDATVQNLLTYYPKIFADQCVSKDAIEQIENTGSSAKPPIGPKCKSRSQESPDTIRLKK